MQEFTAHMEETFFKPMPLPFYALAVAGEAGELANELTKMWRGEAGGVAVTSITERTTEEQRARIAGEAADVLVYLLCLASILNFDLGAEFQRVYVHKILPRLAGNYYKHASDGN